MLNPLYISINTFRSFCCGFATLVAILVITACASQPSPSLPTPEQLAKMRVYHLQVVNNSKKIINLINYRPCGAKSNGFQTLAQNLMPQERVAFNLYDKCIDVRAMNSFGQTLNEQKGLVMSQNAVWELR